MTIKYKLRQKDKSSENYKQNTTQIDCKVVINVGHCETPSQLMMPPDALDRIYGSASCITPIALI